MFEHVDVRSNIAVYVQIENQVQFAIASGKLKADDPLPSLQKLAAKVGVNINTVSKAYRDLQIMGYVHAVRGSGVCGRNFRTCALPIRPGRANRPARAVLCRG